MTGFVGYGLYLVLETSFTVQPAISLCMSSSPRYNLYPTPAHLRARSQILVYGLTGHSLGGRAAGRQRRARDFAGKILE